MLGRIRDENMPIPVQICVDNRSNFQSFGTFQSFALSIFWHVWFQVRLFYGIRDENVLILLQICVDNFTTKRPQRGAIAFSGMSTRPLPLIACL